MPRGGSGIVVTTPRANIYDIRSNPCTPANGALLARVRHLTEATAALARRHLRHLTDVRPDSIG